MARKKTVFQGLSIGPDVELLLLVGGGAALLYWLWNTYGSSATSGISSIGTSIGTDVSNAVSDVTGAL